MTPGWGFLALGAERGADWHQAVSQCSLAAGASEELVHVGVEVVRAFGGVRYCHHADGRERLDGAEHVEHDAAFSVVLEAKVLARRSGK